MLDGSHVPFSVVPRRVPPLGRALAREIRDELVEQIVLGGVTPSNACQSQRAKLAAGAEGSSRWQPNRMPVARAAEHERKVSRTAAPNDLVRVARLVKEVLFDMQHVLLYRPLNTPRGILVVTSPESLVLAAETWDDKSKTYGMVVMDCKVDMHVDKKWSTLRGASFSRHTHRARSTRF